MVEQVDLLYRVDGDQFYLGGALASSDQVLVSTLAPWAGGGGGGDGTRSALRETWAVLRAEGGHMVHVAYDAWDATFGPHVHAVLYKILPGETEEAAEKAIRGFRDAKSAMNSTVVKQVSNVHLFIKQSGQKFMVYTYDNLLEAAHAAKYSSFPLVEKSKDLLPTIMQVIEESTAKVKGWKEAFPTSSLGIALGKVFEGSKVFLKTKAGSIFLRLRVMWPIFLYTSPYGLPVDGEFAVVDDTTPESDANDYFLAAVEGIKYDQPVISLGVDEGQDFAMVDNTQVFNLGRSTVGGEAVLQDLYVFNYGMGPAKLNGSPRVSVAGSSAVTVSRDVGEVVGVDEYDYFTLRLAPTVVGKVNATVTLTWAEGSYTLYVKGDAVAGPAPTLTLTDLEISGDSQVVEGGSGSLLCKGVYSDGSRQIVTPTWTSANSGVLAVDASGHLVAGQVSSDTGITVQAVYQGLMRTKVIQVTDTARVVSSLTVTGAGVVDEGGSGVLGCSALYTDGTSQAVTPVWSSLDTAIVAIDTAGGFVTKAVTVTTQVTVTASYGGKIGSGTITVRDVPVAVRLQSLTVNGAGAVDEGGSLTLICQGTYSDASTKTVTPSWSSNNSSAASVDSAGVVRAGQVNATTEVVIKATLEGIEKTVVVTVRDVPQKVVVTRLEIKGNDWITEGSSYQLSAWATYSDGTSGAVSAAWRSANWVLLSVNEGSGLLTAAPVDSDQAVVISATYQGVNAPSKSVTIWDMTPRMDMGIFMASFHDWTETSPNHFRVTKQIARGSNFQGNWIAIKNIGRTPLSYTISQTSNGWIGFEFGNGDAITETVNPGAVAYGRDASDKVQVTFNMINRAIGDYTASIKLVTGDPAHDQIWIDVTVQVR